MTLSDPVPIAQLQPGVEYLAQSGFYPFLRMGLVLSRVELKDDGLWLTVHQGVWDDTDAVSLVGSVEFYQASLPGYYFREVLE